MALAVLATDQILKCMITVAMLMYCSGCMSGTKENASPQRIAGLKSAEQSSRLHARWIVNNGLDPSFVERMHPKVNAPSCSSHREFGFFASGEYCVVFGNCRRVALEIYKVLSSGRDPDPVPTMDRGDRLLQGSKLIDIHFAPDTTRFEWLKALLKPGTHAMVGFGSPRLKSSHLFNLVRDPAGDIWIVDAQRAAQHRDLFWLKKNINTFGDFRLIADHALLVRFFDAVAAGEPLLDGTSAFRIGNAEETQRGLIDLHFSPKAKLLRWVPIALSPSKEMRLGFGSPRTNTLTLFSVEKSVSGVLSVWGEDGALVVDGLRTIERGVDELDDFRVIGTPETLEVIAEKPTWLWPSGA